MRDLILVRGAPGSGKSTYVKEHHLEPYTISSDAVRMMFSCPEFDPLTGEPHISQFHEQAVWDFIEQTLELRMKTGQFIVLDAQNIKAQRWIKLAEQYRYHIWIAEMQATQEECLARNAARPPLTRVPEAVILASFWRLGNNPLNNRAKPVTTDVVNGDLLPINVDDYKAIHFMGDIHGCYTPLKAFLDDTNGLPEDQLFVFVGDFLDRGLENRKTLELLCSMRDKSNVIFLEGNHHSERLWAEDRVDEIRSREFIYNTMPQLEGLDKKAVREFCRRWRQVAYLEYHGKRYFVTHAGVGFLPEHIRFVPAHTYIRGGAYEDDIDRAWCEKCYGPDVIQVHGHRNWYGYDIDETETSINLCSAVEFGEPWRVYSVYADGDVVYRTYDNSIHREGMSLKRKAELLESKGKATPQECTELLAWNMRSARGIAEKQLPNGISSFNFTRDVFYSVAWDDLNKIARGLFINTIHWKIMARGFEKFFNYNEREQFNTPEWLEEHIQFPVTAWKKYNGFLLLTSWDPFNNQIFYASKSTTEGPHVSLGRRVLNEYFKASPMAAEQIKDYMQKNDVTILWEICSADDPHIIKEWDEQGDKAVCLAIVRNTVKFSEISDEEFCHLTYTCWEDCPATMEENVITNWEELKKELDEGLCAPVDRPTEGWVLKDDAGHRFKVKTAYYSMWKRLRSIKDAIVVSPDSVPTGWDDRSRSIISYMKGLPQDLLELKSIIDIREEWLALGNTDYPYDMVSNKKGTSQR